MSMSVYPYAIPIEGGDKIKVLYAFNMSGDKFFL